MITGVRVHLVDGENVKAFASVVLGDAFVAHGIKVVEGENGLFVAMPQRKAGDEYRDTFHPITAEARQDLSDMVLAEYHRLVNEGADNGRGRKGKAGKSRKAAGAGA